MRASRVPIQSDVWCEAGCPYCESLLTDAGAYDEMLNVYSDHHDQLCQLSITSRRRFAETWDRRSFDALDVGAGEMKWR